jgi:methyl-accepting chemotaxis protein
MDKSSIFDTFLAPAWWVLPKEKVYAQFAVVASMVFAGSFWAVLMGPTHGDNVAYGCYVLAIFFITAILRRFKLNDLRLEAMAVSAAQGNWQFGNLADVPVWSDLLAMRLGQKMIRLNAIVGQSSQDLFQNAKSISQHTAKLANNAEEIASMLEETASGMEQFAATIEVGAANSRSAQERANEVNEAAQAGAVNIGELIHALRLSVEHSRRLSDIVAVIEEIANQTGMLALNAGIEAARAGDQGKGFATVAAEIRELSYRSSESSRDVKTLINSARSGLFQSADLAAKVEADILSIVKRVVEVNQSIADIAHAGVEQQAGISQIKMTVEHMASLTQQNAAGVDATARAAVEIESLAFELDKAADTINGRSQNGREDAERLAHKAQEHISKVGLDRAMDDFANTAGSFWFNDLFVVVTDPEGVTHFHAAQPGLKGTSAFTVVRPESVHSFKHAAHRAVSEGSSWVDYLVTNPFNGNLSRKENFFLSIPQTDKLIAVGYYRDTEKTKKQPTPAIA